MNLRLATFNLFQFAEPPYCWYHPDNQYSEVQWEDKLDWIASQLSLMNADMIGFQEVFSIEALHQLCLNCGYPYLSCIDTPNVVTDQSSILKDPVLALASRYPIMNAEPVIADPNLLHGLSLAPDFSFSRLPIRAQVNCHRDFTLTVYVCHLKSKRPIQLEKPLGQYGDIISKISGPLLSSQQRSAEAAALYLDCLKLQQQNPQAYFALLGDMNDQLDSDTIQLLTSSSHPRLTREMVDGKLLHDGYYLLHHTENCQRPATNYFQGEGQAIDHILLSHSFHPQAKARSSKVVDYLVFNHHLMANGQAPLTQSDHAPVTIELTI